MPCRRTICSGRDAALLPEALTRDPELSVVSHSASTQTLVRYDTYDDPCDDTTCMVNDPDFFPRGVILEDCTSSCEPSKSPCCCEKLSNCNRQCPSQAFKCAPPKCAPPRCARPRCASPRSTPPTSVKLTCASPKCLTPRCGSPKCAPPRCATPKCAPPQCAPPKCAPPPCAPPKCAPPPCAPPKCPSNLSRQSIIDDNTPECSRSDDDQLFPARLPQKPCRCRMPPAFATVCTGNLAGNCSCENCVPPSNLPSAKPSGAKQSAAQEPDENITCTAMASGRCTCDKCTNK